MCAFWIYAITYFTVAIICSHRHLVILIPNFVAAAMPLLLLDRAAVVALAIADLSLNAKAENIILNPTNTETTIRMSKFAGNMNKPM